MSRPISLADAAAEVPGIHRVLRDLNIGPVQAAHEITHDYGFDTTESSVRRYRAKVNDLPDNAEQEASESPADNVTFSTDARDALHAKLDTLLDETNADPGAAKGMRVASWDTVTKNAEGDPVVTKLYGMRLESARWAPSWPVVQPAMSPIVYVQGAPNAVTASYGLDGWKSVLILPDIQAGYYRRANGDLVPLHDLDAIDVAIQIAKWEPPDEILIGGDGMDFAELGRYRLSPAFAMTTQATINWTTEFIATLRGLCPAAKITWLAGNHEERLPNYLLDNAKAAFGLRQGGDTEGWPVFSVPFLCKFDDYGVEYVPGYPASEWWFNDKIVARHGDRVNSGGSTVHKYLASEDVSTITFHIHRIEKGFRTRHGRNGPTQIMAASPGCLCSITGAVPSYKGGMDLDGVPIARAEDWQQGIGVLRYRASGEFSYEDVSIVDGQAVYHGLEFISSL
jgi:hypothetical protein